MQRREGEEFVQMSQRHHQEHVAARTGTKETHKGRKMLSSKEMDQVAGDGVLAKDGEEEKH